MPDGSRVTGVPEVPRALAAGDWVVGEIHLAFGGVAAKTITAPRTESLLTGQPWSEASLSAALVTLAEDVWISPDAPGESRPPRPPHMRTAALVPML